MTIRGQRVGGPGMPRLAALVMATSVALAGCDATVTPAPSRPPLASADASPSQPLRGALTIWHDHGSGVEAVAFDAVLDQVRRSNPDLVLTVLPMDDADLVEQFAAAAPTAGPDLVAVSSPSLRRLASAGLLARLPQDRAGTLPDAAQVALAGSLVDGQPYLVPASIGATAMYLDRTRVGSPPTTTTGLLEAITDGRVRAGFDARSVHPVVGWWAAFGGRLPDGTRECVANAPAIAEAFRYFRDLQLAGARWYADAADIATDFRAGKLNLVLGGPAATEGYRQALGTSLTAAPLPAGPGGMARSLVTVDGWAVNAGSRNPDLAFGVALAMVQPEHQQTWMDLAGRLPADVTVAVDDPIRRRLADAAGTGIPEPPAQGPGAVLGPFHAALAAVIQQNGDPGDAVARACSALDGVGGP